MKIFNGNKVAPSVGYLTAVLHGLINPPIDVGTWVTSALKDIEKNPEYIKMYKGLNPSVQDFLLDVSERYQVCIILKSRLRGKWDERTFGDDTKVYNRVTVKLSIKDALLKKMSVHI